MEKPDSKERFLLRFGKLHLQVEGYSEWLIFALVMVALGCLVFMVFSPE
jgi:hypothetical protein